MLVSIAEALKVPVSDLFGEYAGEKYKPLSKDVVGWRALKVMRLFSELDEKQQKTLLDLAVMIEKKGGDDAEQN